MAPVVVLVGAPGSGKSTVGRLVADRLGVEFRDTDHDVEVLTGRPVGEIFLDDGEVAFRDLESRAVAAALAGSDGVLAVGGGAVESEPTRRLLGGPFVVFLTVGAAEAGKRVGLHAARPVLLGNVRSQWNALLARRAPWYAEVADAEVPTDRRAPDDVAADVIALIPEETP